MSPWIFWYLEKHFHFFKALWLAARSWHKIWKKKTIRRRDHCRILKSFLFQISKCTQYKCFLNKNEGKIIWLQKRALYNPPYPCGTSCMYTRHYFICSVFGDTYLMIFRKGTHVTKGTAKLWKIIKYAKIFVKNGRKPLFSLP